MGPSHSLSYVHAMRALAWVGLALGLFACEADYQTRSTGVRALECISAGDCDDGLACTGEDCIDFHCIYVRYHRRCEGESICLGPGRGCSVARSCTRDGDCDDGDPCTVDEFCDPDRGRCEFRYVGDLDEDGDVTPECGGGDCDDTRADVSVYRTERCDGIDNDCDGAVDEGRPCGMGVCALGACECDSGATLCGDECVRLTSSVEHCGACGVQCPVGGRCLFGECGCPGLLEECAGVCQLPGTARNACGPCQRACPARAECVDGGCVCPESAPTDCGGACANLASDSLHCGACARSCLSCEECRDGACFLREGSSICDGRCADLMIDSQHCGACGSPCERGEYCRDGECECLAPYLECEGACVDVLYDPMNCGGCGVACDGHCSNGTCVCTLCPDDVCRDLSADPDHCGACARACEPTQGCVGSTCVAGGACIERLSFCDSGFVVDEGLAEPPVEGSCELVSTTYCTRGAGGLAGAVRVSQATAGALFTPLAMFSPACIASVNTEPGVRSRALVACATSRTGRVNALLPYLYTEGGYYADGAVVSGADRAAMTVGRSCDDGTCRARLDTDRGESRTIGGRGTSSFAAVAHGGDRWSIVGSFDGTAEGVLSSECSPGTCATSRGGLDALLYRYLPSPASFPLMAFGGAGDDAANDVALLGTDTVVVGDFTGSLTTPRALAGHGGRDGFVARVRADGSVVWLRALGGAGDERALAVAPLGTGVVVAGTFVGEIDLGAGTILRAPGANVFVVALDAFGEPRWARALAGAPGVSARPWVAPRLGLEVVGERVGVALSFSGTLRAGVHSASSAGGVDAGLVIYDALGAALAVRAAGSVGRDEVVGLGVHAAERVFWLGVRAAGPLTVSGFGALGPSDTAPEEAWLIGLRAPD